MSINFTDVLTRLKIKLFAPATIVHRQLGQYNSELRYIAWLPAFVVFGRKTIDKDGYYKNLYVNNKKFKWWYLIPRNACVEVREKPKGFFAMVGFLILSFFVADTAAITATSAIIVGVAATLIAAAGVAAIGFGIASALGKKSGGSSGGGTGTPTYSSKNSPSLSGAKNELAENVVPVAFGRCLQVFNYSQFATPLVKSGYGGNRYRIYSIAGYSNARYSDFRLGDILLSNYRPIAYSLKQTNGGHQFIGWDNAVTESFNKELSFDQSQAVYQSAIAYHNTTLSANSISVTQTYEFSGVNLNSWTDKTFDIAGTYVTSETDAISVTQIVIKKEDLVLGENGFYTANKTFSLTTTGMNEYRYTSTAPNGSTRGNSGENNLNIYLLTETISSGEATHVDDVDQGVNSYNGDRNEIISQSPTETKYGDIHFYFPQGLYSVNTSSGARIRVTIQAEVLWKRKDETVWHGLDDNNIERIYTRNIDGEIENLSSRIGRNGNVLTFRTPDDINNADDKFYECVGLQFKEIGQYQIKALPVVFTKDDYWVGQINIAEVVWRLRDDINVVEPSILPNVTQIACTFNATTQLDGEVDELGAINFPYITNIATGLLEQSRNPVDIIYYLLTDPRSNPKPMSENQIDMQSFLKARQWCAEHDCKCDGIVSDEQKYMTVIDEICNNNQLYFIPNKWGKCVLRVDTNEDGRPIKTLFNATNSWDLSVSRVRGKEGRLLAIRCSFINEETWSDDEITGYWYDNACHWEPQEGYDDLYYQPEKRDLNYIKNADNVKRRIAYELEIANVKNVTASFKVAREVLDLEVLDRVLVADYTRMNDGVSGTIETLLYNEDNTKITGFVASQPFKVTNGMTVTIRSIDTSGEGFNVNTYSLIANNTETTKILFQDTLDINTSIMRGTGFYNVDGENFYYSGDIYMAGTAEILNMVVSEIEEVKGDDFTSSVTCRLY